MSADPYGHDPDAMQGYVALIGAILHRALADTRLRMRHGTQGHTHPTREDQEDARALLLSRERLTFFCELMGAEVSGVRPALLTAAGLPSPRPLGAPRGASSGTMATAACSCATGRGTSSMWCRTRTCCVTTRTTTLRCQYAGGPAFRRSGPARCSHVPGWRSRRRRHGCKERHQPLERRAPMTCIAPMSCMERTNCIQPIQLLEP